VGLAALVGAALNFVATSTALLTKAEPALTAYKQ
jgi:hypothetical protein